jgi:response regulator RpfG family c-di-GMP phosphodiesterase
MGDMRPFDPEMAKLYEEDSELDRLTRDLGDRYQKAKESERAEVLTKLKAAVVKHFEIRQQRRELELKRLEEQLDRLRSSMKRRGEQQDEIIKQRVDELIGKPDDLGF